MLHPQSNAKRPNGIPADMPGSHDSRPVSTAFDEGRGAKAGGPDFGSLRARLERTVRATCPIWLAADADDLVQTTMMRLMRIEERYSDAKRFRPAYLKRAAHSVLVDEIRRRRRRREVPLEDEAGPKVEPDLTADDPERVSVGREIGLAIKRCLAKVIGDRRLAVALFLQEHTVPQSASLMGCTPKRAENLRYRGLADLRKCLQRRGLTP